jgi:peptide-methionine (S)-S-oxide reductase
MMDLLIDAGAKPGGGKGALAHGNIDAARRLIERGGKLTLTTAVGLDRMDDVMRLVPMAGDGEQLTALTAAAFYGKADMITFLLAAGVAPNGYPENSGGFHQHATPLHQAVSSGSMDAVKLLVEAGAKLDARDKIYDGTPLDWACYMKNDDSFDEKAKKNFALIAGYLAAKQQGK